MRANTVFLLALFGFCAISFSSANRWDAMRGINAVDERASSTSADSDADAETEAAAERPRPNSAVPKTLRKMIENGYKDWTAYKNYHGKTSYDEEMEKERMLSFFSAQQHVEKHNAIYQRGDASFEVGLTSVADLPYSDYKKLNGYRPLMGDVVGRKNSSKFLTPMNIDVPESVDWRDHGYVTDVKNQGLCGSCWAFSTTGSLEGQHMRATKNLVSLSEQNLVDCSTAYGNNGCNGGLMDFAFQYIKDNHGIDTETSYPYKAKERVCHFKKEAVGADDTGFVDLPKGDEEALKTAVATQGPISVAIDAGHRSFQLYHKGVYYEKECSADQLDHGVLVVGYGTDPVHGDYWIVKNSWGTNWGENGYVRMARNRNNHCGIASSASYPLV